MFSFLFAFSLSLFAPEEKSFVAWMRDTDQIYTGKEYHFRLGVWLANMRYVQAHNSKSHSSFKLKMNKLSAFTQSEYKLLAGTHVSRFLHSSRSGQFTKATEDDKEIDWRQNGYVSPVQDQGQCTSDWAFSAVASAESCTAIKSGKLTPLSVQNLLDCNPTCYGCVAGIASVALQYIIDSQAGKLSTDDEYPYTAAQGVCKFNAETAVYAVSSWASVESGNENALATAVEEMGPAAAVVDASLTSFQLYSSGIYNDKNCSPYDPTHAVAIVGFGIQGSSKYWIVKNSWGVSWGEEGYMRLVRGDNMCGIASIIAVSIP